MSEIEKAYGGCRICYGKGYHTKRVGTSSRYGNVTHDTIGYCTCDRGKQLEVVISGRISEVLDRLEESSTQILIQVSNTEYANGGFVPLSAINSERKRLRSQK